MRRITDKKHMRLAIILIPLSLATIANDPVVEAQPSPPPVIVASAPDTSGYDTAWRALVDKIADELNLTDPELAHTVALAVESAAVEFDVNPWLIVSLIRVESMGNPSAVSKVGAIGLTQIMPITGREIARDLHLAEYDLYDPATNVRMGAYYISQLLIRFDRDKRSALSAYNFGPTAVSRLLHDGDKIPEVYASKVLRALNNL